MYDVVLYQPEIPPNTGNIIRLCANTGFALHLIAPLGFDMEERRLRRAGLDYREWARVRTHDSLDAYLKVARPTRLLAFSTRGTQNYASMEYRKGDALLFGRKPGDCRSRCWSACLPQSAPEFPCSREIAASTYPTRWRWCVTKHGGNTGLPATRMKTRGRNRGGVDWGARAR